MHEEIHEKAKAMAECAIDDDAEEVVHHHFHHKTDKEGTDMGDIAGLMALMQGNKGMDLPGLLALCKDKGYDKGGFGGEGMFLFVFLILFLFAGGNMGLGGANRAAAAGLVGEDNCQRIIGIHDRISAAQAASTQGFQQLDTNLCSSIAEVIAAVRNQGDRSVEATNSVSRQLSDCCCAMQQKMDAVLCAIKDTNRQVELSELRLGTKIDNLGAAQALGFERLGCKMDNIAKDTELARLQRENCELKTAQTANITADTAVRRLEGFLATHYQPNPGCRRS